MQKEREEIDSETGKASEIVNIYDEVMKKIGAEEWGMIARHYQLEGLPDDHKNVSIPLKCSRIDERNPRTIPSEDQMKRALEIRRTALKEGFDYIAS